MVIQGKYRKETKKVSTMPKYKKFLVSVGFSISSKHIETIFHI